MSGILDKLNPCPLCRQKDRTEITSEVSFGILKSGGNENICVAARCWRCGLEVKAFSCEVEGEISYERMIEEVSKKWNSLRSIKEKTDVSSAEDTMHSNGITSSGHTTENIPKKTV